MIKLSDTQSILMYHSVVKNKNCGLEFFKIKLQSLANLQYCVLYRQDAHAVATSLLLASNNILQKVVIC